jgi:AcrR family transcriptional regulator
VPIDVVKKEKEKRILESAAALFAQKGYAGASIAEIAVKAGVGKGTVYEYFKNKEDLFFAVFQWFMQKTGTAATVSVSALGGSATQRLTVLNESMMRLWDELKDVFTLVMEFWSASSSSQLRKRFRQAFKQAYQEFRAIVSAIIHDGIQRGEYRADIDPEAVAAALVGTWDALLLQAWFDSSFDPLKIANRFLPVVIDGLRKPEGV